MRTILLVAGTVGLIGLLSACGGDARAPAVSEGGASTGGKGGKGGSAGKGGKGGSPSEDGGAGQGGDGTVVDPLAPVVTMVSPEGAETPDDGVLSGTAVTATCRVEPSPEAGSAAVDTSSVTIMLVDGESEEIEQKASPGENENEFESEFVLTNVPAGRVTFRCSALDTEKRRGVGEVDTFVDHGPSITPVSPKPGVSYPVIGGLPVEFQIAGVPLAEEDPGAEVASVTFEFDGEEYDLEEGPKGTFRTALPIDDPEEFPQLPQGSVVVRATNKRGPEPVTASLAYSAAIDGEGPTITITSPTPQAVVGGKVTIAMTIRDDVSGVDPASVSITRYNGDEPQTFDVQTNWTAKGDRYTFTFDSKEVEKYEKVQTTVGVRARDKVGNQSANGQSIQLYLDNVPPRVDLDPLPIRVSDRTRCSVALDPVGPLALNDLAGQLGTAQQSAIGFFRAYVEELGNRDFGQILYEPAGTDTAKTRLYVLPSPESADVPLLVNNNPQEDDTCDDIGAIDSLTGAPDFTAMTALPDNTGSAWFGPNDNAEPTIEGCIFGTAAPPQRDAVQQALGHVLRPLQQADQRSHGLCGGYTEEFGRQLHGHRLELRQRQTAGRLGLLGRARR